MTETTLTDEQRLLNASVAVVRAATAARELAGYIEVATTQDVATPWNFGSLIELRDALWQLIPVSHRTGHAASPTIEELATREVSRLTGLGVLQDDGQ